MYVKGKKVRQEVAGPRRLSRKLGTTLCEGHRLPPPSTHPPPLFASAGSNCNTPKDLHVLVPAVQGEDVLMWHRAVESEGAPLCRVGQELSSQYPGFFGPRFCAKLEERCVKWERHASEERWRVFGHSDVRCSFSSNLARPSKSPSYTLSLTVS
ncbi:hypothetical protein E2C01_007029 [Portunus trituberculatus]|uniref:Uncharacterized protein n=1 Tax=Portunus trituberculatus TaxID=210409 RepID=A0A5B7D199_PORTR|nr:hypothetical protein [Portunus trituberculatus]